ncbi:MAG TPA: molecular chaperone HtpG [Caldithrix abyssi]|uniref:Chaperone protein HtpG n=1 Tax=Caldithrix abyssi TaxID=187145 RepID=A0A7V5H232_CALAY|nr:molecular chaperone HtpG [Caldithrix abyssi]
MEEQAKTYKFKAEVNQLLDILVHSLYTNREIFLRELISNASDALDKVRFEMTRSGEVIDKDLPLEINIELDKDKKWLKISDTGIGMTREEIVKNIGTIAKSGTADFLERLSKEKDAKDLSSIIGKFGVGFYSVFMVAEKVEIISKSYLKDEPAVKWISDGKGSFKVMELEETPKRGTTIIVHLKEDAKEFAEDWRVKEIIKKHSNFINFDIKVNGEKVNTIRAIWREPKSSIKKEQYEEFYKFLTYDPEPPLDVIHVAIDAPVQFYSIMFIPQKNYNVFGFTKEDFGLDLYVRGVLIQHKFSEIIPEYLGFVKGMVDSPDIPLNISRETLQENRVVIKIKQVLVKQVLSHLEKMAQKEPEKYKTFWNEHGKIFKLGYQDYSNQEKFAELLRFDSSALEKEGELTSLADYVSRAKPDQKEIYYITGASREALQTDPHLEIFKRKGIEVLYLYDPVDEFVITGLPKYKNDYTFVAVEHADISKLEKFEDVVKDEEKVEELSKGEEKVFKKLLDKMRDILGDRVTEVRESKRLKDSAACLVSPDGQMTSQMQKILQIMNKDTTIPKKIFEVNKDHPLIRNLLRIYKNDPKDPFITEATEQLFETALLMEGYLNDPHKLVRRMETILTKSSEWHPQNKTQD